MCFRQHLPRRVALLPPLPLRNRSGLMNLCVVIIRAVILAALMGTECGSLMTCTSVNKAKQKPRIRTGNYLGDQRLNKMQKMEYILYSGFYHI